MVDQMKIWFIEVAIKKMLPSLIKTSIMALIAYMAAHQNLLSALGVSWAAQGHSINIDLDTLSAWALIAIPGAITALLTAFQHHTIAAVTGTPQSGDMRQTSTQPAINGDRKGDPQ